MYHTYLRRIEDMADFLSNAPIPDQAVDFLSAKISPFDEITFSFRGKLSDDGVIHCENLHGSSKFEVATQTTMHISDFRPISHALRTQKTVWAKRETVTQEFRDFVSLDSRTPWTSLCSIPISMNRVYSFGFPSDVTELEGVESYFDAVKSLLKFYENSLEGRTQIHNLEGEELSQRQEVILSMLREGKTNKSIALAIGYSESLVRHETMNIYKKLGVEGRHQLQNKA